MRFLSGGPRVREYLTGVTKMTEQRNSRIALLAVVMLLSGAFLGLLVSDNASAARYDLNGFVSDNNSNVSITISSLMRLISLKDPNLLIPPAADKACKILELPVKV